MVYWTRITKLQSRKQRKLFDESLRVYEEFMRPIIREPWENFEYYILDDEETKKQGGVPESEYFYYVAVFNDRVCGMADFDIYRKEVGVIAYLVIRDRKQSHDPRDPPADIVRRMSIELVNIVRSAANQASCEGILFEVERVHPKYLDRRRTAAAMIEPQQGERLQWIHVLQGRYEAKKIAWIKYHQPKLEWEKCWQEYPMHLMFISLTLTEDEHGVIRKSRNDIKRLMKFIYLTWYYEGYECTERGPDRDERLKQWKLYLEKLYKEAIIGLPKEISLQKLPPLGYRPRVYISYPTEEPYLTVAERAQAYLAELEFPPFFFPREKPRLIGEKLDPTLRKKMDNSKVFLVLLGEATLSVKPDGSPKHEGQQKELDYIRDNVLPHINDRKVILLILEDSSKYESFEEWLPKSKDIIYDYFNWQNYHKKIENVATSILTSKPR